MCFFIIIARCNDGDLVYPSAKGYVLELNNDLVSLLARVKCPRRSIVDTCSAVQKFGFRFLRLSIIQFALRRSTVVGAFVGISGLVWRCVGGG